MACVVAPSIGGADGIPYGEVLSVMDEIKQAGVDTVGLATEPPREE